jgi:hypothetical protein
MLAVLVMYFWVHLMACSCCSPHDELLVILGVSVFLLPVQLCCMYISGYRCTNT